MDFDGEEVKLFKNFEKNLRELISGLEKVRRWKHKKSASHENLFQHQYKMVWLAQLLIALKERSGNRREVNFYRILQCAANHDIAEILTDDIPWYEKNGSDKEIYEAKERNAFVKMIEKIIPRGLRQSFPPPFDLDEKRVHSVSKKFWQGVESIGYIYFALEELRRDPKNRQIQKDFLRVFRTQAPILKELSSLFVSVKTVYKMILEEKESVLKS